MTEISDDELDALRQRRMAEMQKSREQNAAQEKAISESLKKANEFLAKKFLIPQKNMNIFGVFVIHSLKLLKKKN